jgi:hypothetical protein
LRIRVSRDVKGREVMMMERRRRRLKGVNAGLRLVVNGMQ